MTDLRVALVGYGFVGKVFHAPLITHTGGLHLHTVVSRDAGKVHADYPDVHVAPTAEQAFSDPAIDLVVIASPNDSHAPLALAALDAGKHVVVDKPFTVTLSQAREVIERARLRQRKLSVFQNRRWDVDFLAVQALLREGTLGNIAEFHSHFDRFRPQVQARWRESDQPGAGLWFDLGPHLIDQALQLFGPPLAVQADLARQREGARATDYFHVQLRYPHTRVHLHAGSLVTASFLRFAVHGDQGSFVKLGLDPQEDRLRTGGQPGERDWGKDPSPGILTRSESGQMVSQTFVGEAGDYRRYYKAMREAIVHDAPLPVSAYEALQVMRIIELGELSSAQRRELAFDDDDAG